MRQPDGRVQCDCCKSLPNVVVSLDTTINFVGDARTVSHKSVTLDICPACLLWNIGSLKVTNVVMEKGEHT